MKKNKIFFIFLLAMCTVFSAIAQNRAVTGNITDENGEPIIGASIILIDNNKIGTISDIDGRFVLANIPPENNSIRITYIGYVAQVIDITGKQVVSTQLVPSDLGLNEVVVVGYGTQKKAHLTGSVVTIPPEEIKDLVGTDLSSALVGQVAGVAVISGGNRPGESARIVIRNSDDIENAPEGGDLSPLYVIDGFISNASTFNNLDPNVIESLSIIKDAAAAVYGSRAGQGVILVTTKRGHNGKARISYNGSYGYTDEFYRSKMMDAYNYGVIWNTMTTANPKSSYDELYGIFQADELEAMKGLDYNLLEQHWRPAIVQKHSINLSGGNDNATFFGGITYNTQDGNIGRIQYNRWDYRAGMDAKISQWLKASLQVSGTYGNSQRAKNSVGSSNGEKDYAILLTHLRHIPEYVTNPQTGLNYPIAPYGISNTERNISQNFHYDVIENNGDFVKSKPQNMQINSSIDYNFGWNKWLNGLKLRFTYSKNIGTGETNTYGSQYMLYRFLSDAGGGSARGGSGNHLYTDTGEGVMDFSRLRYLPVSNGNELGRSMNRSDSYQINFMASYMRTFGLHDVSGLFTIERSESESENVEYNVSKPYDFTNYQSNGADGVATEGETRGSFGRNESGNLSYVGRLNYAYSNKYLAEYLLRVDASTKFAPENYWGYFHSASVGWIISEELWFRDNVSFVDFLKIRSSFGLVGRDNIKSWTWAPFYGYENFKGPIFGNSANLAAGQHFQIHDDVPNRNAHWDKVYKGNLGLDMNFLRNRLSVTYEAYYNWQRDVFMNLQSGSSIPGTVGAEPSVSNYGAIDDWGMELSLGWKDKIGKDFKYSVRVNTEWNDNKYITAPFRPLNDRGLEDQVPGERSDRGLWGYDCIGMFRSYQEIAEYFAENNLVTYLGNTVDNVHPGTLIFRDIRGSKKNDGSGEYYAVGDPDDPSGNVINASDYIKISNRDNNIYNFSINLSCNYKDFSLSTQLGVSWGSYTMIPNTARQLRNTTITSESGLNAMEFINMPSFYAGEMFAYQDILDAQGRVVVPQNLNAKYPNMANDGSSAPSTFWRINAANVFLRNISISYSLPKNVASKLQVESCRINVTAQNLFEFYNPYPDKFTSPNSSYDRYPTLRRINVGLNISF